LLYTSEALPRPAVARLREILLRSVGDALKWIDLIAEVDDLAAMPCIV
jgi:hypothetical protein